MFYYKVNNCVFCSEIQQDFETATEEEYNDYLENLSTEIQEQE